MRYDHVIGPSNVTKLRFFMMRKMMAPANLICKGETLNSPPADRWLSQPAGLSLKRQLRPEADCACSHVVNPSIIKRLLFSFHMATATLIDCTPPSGRFFQLFALSLLYSLYFLRLNRARFCCRFLNNR